MEMEMEGGKKWKILFFGGTGYIGKYMVRASVALGHPTFVYARPLPPHRTPPANPDLRDQFRAIGVTIFQGELEEHEKMVSAMKEVDVVISALPYPVVLAQLKIIQAIQAARNIKRFVPSDYGVEEDRVLTALPPFQAFLDKKKSIRRATEAAGIPYTYVSANCFGAYFVNLLLHPSDQRNDVLVYGTGDAKAVFNYEEDVARYTVRVSCDPRACNRVVIYRPSKNIFSQNELISLWEKKTGRSFERVHLPGDEIVRLSQTLPGPESIPVSIAHSIFVKGDMMNYELKDDDVEASRLYPDMDYTSTEQLLDIFLIGKGPPPTLGAFA